jgi:hypothetical protein
MIQSGMPLLQDFDPADFRGTKGHDTPASAACADIPREYVRVVRVRRCDGGSWALVVIEVNEAPSLAWEEDYVVCHEGKWHAVCGGGALGPAK